jgi:hypothetical protein
LASASKQKKSLSDDESGEASAGGLRFKTKLGRNVYRVLFESEPVPKVNELFMPHRMAYIVDLTNETDESATADIPLTSIRSKADCPTNEVRQIAFIFR